MPQSSDRGPGLGNDQACPAGRVSDRNDHQSRQDPLHVSQQGISEEGFHVGDMDPHDRQEPDCDEGEGPSTRAIPEAGKDQDGPAHQEGRPPDGLQQRAYLRDWRRVEEELTAVQLAPAVWVEFTGRPCQPVGLGVAWRWQDASDLGDGNEKADHQHRVAMEVSPPRQSEALRPRAGVADVPAWVSGEFSHPAALQQSTLPRRSCTEGRSTARPRDSPGPCLVLKY